MDQHDGPRRGDLFFAYGTLKRGAPMFQRLKLARSLAACGPAAMAGALLSLGEYPGMTAGRRGRVHGELYRVLDPAVFGPLDAYEEFTPADAARSLFVRVRAPLLGRRGTAWVYVYAGRRKGTAVPCGRWRRLRSRKRRA